MKSRNNVLLSLTLFIILLSYHGDHFTAGNEQICEVNFKHDTYRFLNDLVCRDDISNINLSVIERYTSRKKPDVSNFDIAGIHICNPYSSLISKLHRNYL